MGLSHSIMGGYHYNNSKADLTAKNHGGKVECSSGNKLKTMKV